MNEEATTEKTLNADSTLNEVFEFFDMEGGGVRVAPMTVKEDPKDTRLLLMVRGDIETASVIFSEVVDRIAELSDLEKQAEASRDKSRIITR